MGAGRAGIFAASRFLLASAFKASSLLIGDCPLAAPPAPPAAAGDEVGLVEVASWRLRRNAASLFFFDKLFAVFSSDA